MREVLVGLLVVYTVGAVVSWLLVLVDLLHVRGIARCPVCNPRRWFALEAPYRTFLWPVALYRALAPTSEETRDG